ncbi:hypothetical protein VHEMI07902 [[Torrubiella] hemipterigena]|uniref:Sulfotransferase domain-containing protein n=1 Tax=[Torrubiella] hemipterigena TaxID=1531966 RepID=A0A0A1TM94_9HYPO|nr:hypothetical protein VHEMI07902 [[Torrubiella] hemipterigena]
MRSHTPQRYYLITYPRTASNLLIRILDLKNQPNVTTGDDRGGYIFLPVVKLITDMGLRKKKVESWTATETTRVKNAYQDCFDEFQATIGAASAADCSVYIKEHVHFLVDPASLSGHVFGETDDIPADRESWKLQIPQPYEEAESPSHCINPTLFPDEFLLTWKPTFLIRHPALAFPSLYRALLELEGRDDDDDELKVLGQHCMTLRWTRMLYIWYKQTSKMQHPWPYEQDNVEWPVVLDADDVINSPALVQEYAEMLGLDPTKLAFSWTPATKAELSQMDTATKRYLDTLLGSGKIMKDKTSDNVDISTQVEKWTAEFGKAAAMRIEQLVREAMPDYEMLGANRLRL